VLDARCTPKCVKSGLQWKPSTAVRSVTSLDAVSARALLAFLRVSTLPPNRPMVGGQARVICERGRAALDQPATRGPGPARSAQIATLAFSASFLLPVRRGSHEVRILAGENVSHRAPALQSSNSASAALRAHRTCITVVEVWWMHLIWTQLKPANATFGTSCLRDIWSPSKWSGMVSSE
jgi:hypothetical protein